MEIKTRLEKSDHISLIKNMWTSTENDDYLSLTGHFIYFKQNNLCIEVIFFSKVNQEKIKYFIKTTIWII